ncbi:MAG: 3-phosphoshikimate 1-carboxyvinyltransferase [Syntrophobacterales bacterium]|nr:3-phosphoshikimate 1-carboxyvinyltransferase [Syntrophobacterales bacterium]
MDTTRAIRPRDKVEAVVSLPGSKSLTHRALIASALAAGESLVTNALVAEDTRLTAQALRKLGAALDWEDTTVRIRGTGGRLKPVAEPLHFGNSGTSHRFFTALVSLGEGEYCLTGTPRLCQRPVGELLAALKLLGVKAVSQRGDGCPPVLVTGGLTGGHTRLSGQVSSQYLSALLLIGPLAPLGVEVEITGELVSRPYVDLTLEVMAAFGISFFRRGYRYFQVPGGQTYQPREYAVEGDASSAAYFWAAAAVTGGRVTVANLSVDSTQGDIDFLSVLARMGCHIESSPAGLTVAGGPLHGITVDMSAMPDQVPTLAVVAAFAQGETVMTGVGHLRHKESDRLAAVATELRKMGGEVEETGDGLLIRGGRPLTGAVIHTYDDHRIAMSFAVAGLSVPGVVIEDPGCVAKSFPEFWRYWETLEG